jgi:SSS family solute:Na+ symporter
LIAAVFGSLSANALGSAALIMKDFYVPFVKPSEKHKLVASRVAAIVIGLVPIPFALFLPELLKTLFFARALRTTISLVAVCLFYAPFFSSGRGVVLALIASVIGTTSWYLLGNPFGIDNTYIALILPLVIMGIDHLFKATVEPATPPPVLAERY